MGTRLNPPHSYVSARASGWRAWRLDSACPPVPGGSRWEGRGEREGPPELSLLV